MLSLSSDSLSPRPLLAAVVATASLAGAAPAAAAAVGNPGLATIVAPKTELAAKHAVEVRVRVRPGAQIRATVGTRPVTGRFGPAHGGIRSARLRRGKELARGLNHLAIRTTAGSRSDFDSLDLVVARRDRGFLTLREAPRGSTAGTPTVRAIWRNAPHGFRARLNGRDVSREFLTRVGTATRARLGADDGLRFGRNRLVVTAFDERGRFDREVRGFRIRRTAPLVVTKPERRVGAGLPLRLDARGSRPARGGKLTYHWRIVRRPGGSTARLANATSARPTLVPDVRGRYRLRLRVVERGARRSRKHAGASQLETLSAATTMEVLAPTLPGPMGFPISTIPAGIHGMQIAGTTYATNANWVQVSLFDRATLEPKDAPAMSAPSASHPATGQYAFNTTDNPQSLRDLVTAKTSGIDASFLVVMTGGGRSIPIAKSQWQALTYAFGQLGGTMDPFLNDGKGKSDPGFGNGAWSLIGIPGLTAGTAAQNWNLSPSPGAPPGGIEGHMAWDSQSNYTFIAGDYQAFDTNVTGQNAPSGGTNQMSVGGASYASQALGSGQSGFQVVALDAGTLAPLANDTFVTNDSHGQVTSNVQAMYRLIQSYVANHANVVFLVQSIGAPNPLNAAWTGPKPPSLAEAIGQIGGTADLFNSLTPPGSKWGYALVGGTKLSPTDAVEEAFNPENPTLVPPPARLHGLLKRGDQYGYQPTTTSSFNSPTYQGFDLSAVGLAFQPSTDTWPTHDTAAHRAAEDYVAREVFYPDLLPTQRGYDLHTYYWDADWLDNATTYASALNSVCPPSGAVTVPAGATFGTADLKFVCGEIQKEFTWVQAVWGMSRTVRASFTQQEILGPSSASAIADEITHALGSQRGSGESELVADVLMVEGTLLEAASEAIFATGGEDGLGMAASIGTMSGIFDMAADFANSPTGQPDLATFDTQAKNIGFAIQANYRNAMSASDKLSQLLVSDYAKLSTAGPKAQDPNTWGFDQTRLTALANSVELSTTRYIWAKLLPGAFKVYNLGAGGDRWLQEGQGTWTPKTYRCYNNDNGLPGGPIIWPFRRAPSSGWQNQTVGIKHGKPYRQPNVLANHRFRFIGETGRNSVVEGYAAAPVPSGITNPLFKPVIADQFSNTSATLITQAGLNRPEFLAANQGIFTRVDVQC